MHFNGPIVRPQTDAYSLFIEVTVGCSHNSCKFCNFYHGYRFCAAPLSQIEEDLKEAKAKHPKAKEIWANGGNPYALSFSRLEKIGLLFKKYFPDARVSAYARVDDLCRKTVDEMRRLKELGFSDLLVGIECGDDEALSNMNKGYTAADIYEGCSKLESAGVDYRVIYLGGLLGEGRGEQTALNTAALLNKLHPYMIYLNTVSVLPGTELFEEKRKGIFIEQGERERTQELITLVENLNNEIMVFAAPNTTRFSFWAELPRDKTRLLKMMYDELNGISDEEERRMRNKRLRQASV